MAAAAAAAAMVVETASWEAAVGASEVNRPRRCYGIKEGRSPAEETGAAGALRAAVAAAANVEYAIRVVPLGGYVGFPPVLQRNVPQKDRVFRKKGSRKNDGRGEVSHAKRRLVV